MHASRSDAGARRDAAARRAGVGARRSDGQLGIVEGSLYPALHRLEAAGLVASSTEEIDGRRRRRYELTADGKSALEEEARAWELFKTNVDAVLRQVP
jgi:DNA-binding PadR family transcriptional regulator